MIAGRLNEVVDIYQLTETVNDYGERSQDFANVYTTRARVESNSGNRVSENNEIVYSYNRTFHLRSYVPVDETSLIQWQGKKYRVLTLEHRREYNDIVVNTELVNE